MKIRTSGFLSLLLLLTGFFSVCAPAPAFAGGEDFQVFQADCNGYDENTGTYPRGTTCTVNLLHGVCLYDVTYGPGGFNAQVLKLKGRRWVAVTRVTHYAACDSTEFPKINRNMSFKANSSEIYTIRVDGVRDGKPPFLGPVVAMSSFGDSMYFAINVRP